MSDQAQTETGADVNALRNNIPVGESREYTVAAVKPLAAGNYLIGAWVTDDDVDLDEVNVAEGVVPKRGENLLFTHEADGNLTAKAVA